MNADAEPESVEAWGDLALLGTLSEAVRAALRAAGFQDDPTAELAVASPSAGEVVRLLRNPERVEQPLVILADDDEVARLAEAAGAIDVIRGPFTAEALRARLSPLYRMTRVNLRRLKAQEQRARRAMDDLQSTRDLLGRLIDATPNPVMATDTSGRVLVFNRAAEAALGYESQWARDHMHVTEVYADASDARRVLAELRAQAGGIAQVEVRLRARSGEIIPVELAAAEVFSAKGTPIATVGVFDDQRPELALKRRLAATTEQLIATEKRAAAMEVAGAAAHELNQPLTAVMGSLELLHLREDLPAGVHTRLDRAYEQLERMAEIVRSLARTSRPRTVGYVGQTRILDLSSDTE
jgi:PAS domain S-box-containing protein